MTVQEQIKALRDQRKALDEQTAKLREGIPQAKFEGNKRVEIGGKGTLNFYGLGKFPICLYFSQLKSLRETINSKEFADFLDANVDKLAAKAEKKQA